MTDWKRLLPIDRLNAQIEIDENGCWNWTGSKDGLGYGFMMLNKKLHRAHRAAYMLFIGPIPDGAELHHICEQKGCVNPDHLIPITRKEHIRKHDSPTGRAAKATHCPAGHPYNPENTCMTSRGGRICRQCRNASVRAWGERNPEKMKAMRAKTQKEKGWIYSRCYRARKKQS